MATTKKSTARKKSTTSKAAAARKTPAKKVAHSKRQPKVQSFRASQESEPFMTFRITRQSLYWLIFTVVIFFLGAWIFRLEIEIQGIYDSIDANNLSSLNLQAPTKVHTNKQ